MEVIELEFKERKFRIEKDHPEVGVYLYIYENEKCVKDYLQNTIEACKEITLQEYGVPLNKWEESSV